MTSESNEQSNVRGKPSSDVFAQRIERAPEISQDELLREAFGSDEIERQSVWRGVVRGETPPPAEWIESPEAGMYVDELAVPLYSPNGGGLGGDASDGSEQRIRDWIKARRVRIAERAKHLTVGRLAVGEVDLNGPTGSTGDTE